MLEWGKLTGDREQLGHAESEFEAMGCKFFLAQARRRLHAPDVVRPAVVA